MVVVRGSPRDRTFFLAMSKKGGAGRPSAGGGRYEVYLGMDAEATVVII